MCINVLRGRSRPFKFGWVWNTFCYANTSVLLPRLLITWPHVGYVLYGGALSSHQKGTHGLWSIETVNSQPRISTDSNKNQSNGKIRINDIDVSLMWNIFTDIFFWQTWPLKWVKDLWQLSYFSTYTVADWSIDLYLCTQIY